MKTRKKRFQAEYDPEFLKTYMSTPVKEKLRFLEQSAIFFSRMTPRRSKKAWERLKARGW